MAAVYSTNLARYQKKIGLAALELNLKIKEPKNEKRKTKSKKEKPQKNEKNSRSTSKILIFREFYAT